MSQKKSVRTKVRRSPKQKITWFSFFMLSAAAFFLVLFGVSSLNSDNSSHSFCANSISCIKDLSGKYEPDNTGVFMGRRVTSSPIADNTNFQSVSHVLGASTYGPKHIYVNLSNQTLEAREGNTTVMSFPVSTGKWHPTPTGDFNIWIKLLYTRMVGGSKALGTYYNLPNVPYTMFFANNAVPKSAGYGLHGAYWHNNFGHPMSHGCVNISPANAQLLYSWADPPTAAFTTYASASNPGTPITIFGVPPANEVDYLD